MPKPILLGIISFKVLFHEVVIGRQKPRELGAPMEIEIALIQLFRLHGRAFYGPHPPA